jgi:hypothetical protein
MSRLGRISGSIGWGWLFGIALVAPSYAWPNTLANSRLSITLNEGEKWLRDNDRVDSLTWINSSGVTTANLVANAVNGPFTCGDPVEFFGQADGYPVQADPPLMVVPGEISSGHDTDTVEERINTHGKACKDSPTLNAATRTIYKLGNTPHDINSVKIIRDFLFGPTTPTFKQSGLRPYMARVPLQTYAVVKLPDSTGKIVKYNVDKCADNCTVIDWNGTWFADDDGKGNGVAIIRAASSLNPAFIVLDNDSYSQSNVSSLVLAQPGGGWTAAVEETEYLCVYDSVSWPAHKQKTGKLPTGCEVK